IGLIIIRSASNDIRTLMPFGSIVLEALGRAVPGAVITLTNI
ncbi:MAG: hypothetical protein QOJ65_2164, partial [Fimbriimonadaceae bacterium]|nr:hypothetical protein [Fimbriimonadaceae bacterium]